MKVFLATTFFLALIVGAAFAAPIEEGPCSFGEDISLEGIDLPGIPLFMHSDDDSGGILDTPQNYYYHGISTGFGVLLDLDTVHSVAFVSYRTPDKEACGTWASMAAVRVYYQERVGWSHDTVHLGVGSLQEVTDTMLSLYSLPFFVNFSQVFVINMETFDGVIRHGRHGDFSILSLDGDVYRVNVTQETLALIFSKEQDRDGFLPSFFSVHDEWEQGEGIGAPPASRTGGNVPSEILRELFPDVIISPGEGKVSTTWGAIKSSR